MKLCDLDTAKALQELGYDGEYSCWIDREEGTIERDKNFLYDWHIPCPRLDDAAYWMREKYGFVIWITYLFSGRWNPHLCDINDEDNGLYSFAKAFDKFEDALEFVLKEAIEIIKTT